MQYSVDRAFKILSERECGVKAASPNLLNCYLYLQCQF